MKYYLSVLKNYATFRGRARRSEYWYFTLFNFIFAIIAGILDTLVGSSFTIETINGPVQTGYGFIYMIYTLAMFVPGLSVAVRRLHDIGKSGWYILVVLIPLAGFIWLLVLLFTDSEPGNNKYGPNPKGIGNFDEIDQIGSDMVQPGMSY